MANRNQGRGGGKKLQGLQDALSNPDQLAALVAVLQLLQSQQTGGQSPDVGTLPSNFPTGGFATTSGDIPVSGVGPATLGGMPFAPNPIAQGIASAGTLFANTNAARQASQDRASAKRRQEMIDELTRILVESARPKAGQPDSGRGSAAGRVGLGKGRRLPATRGDRRVV